MGVQSLGEKGNEGFVHTFVCFNMLLFTYIRWALELNETSFVLLPLKPTLKYSPFMQKEKEKGKKKEPTLLHGKQDCVSNLLDNNSKRINLAIFNQLTFTNHCFNFYPLIESSNFVQFLFKCKTFGI